MLVQTLYALGLLVGVALACQNRCPLLIRSALVLAANFIACNLAVISTGSATPVVWFLFFDVASAFALMWQPTGRTPAILARVYFVQLGLHYAHWASHSDAWGYLTMLTLGGGLQIAFLIMGAVNGDGRKVRRGHDRRSRYDVAVASIRARIEQEQA